MTEFSTLFYLKIIAPHQGEIVLEALRYSVGTAVSKRKTETTAEHLL